MMSVLENNERVVWMTLDLIKNLSNAFGVSGFEEEVGQVALDYIGQDWLDGKDKMGNIYLNQAKSPSKKLKIILDAHMDEVGFIVQAIRPNGMIDFLPVGGWLATNVPAHSFIIRTEAGDKIKAISASTPPHFMSESDRNKPLSMEDLVLDVGCSSRQEVEALGITIGDPIVPDVDFQSLRDDQLLFGKAFDCRIGCACLLDTFKTYQEQPTNDHVHLSAILTVQEEVGLRGASLAAKQIQADLAIVFEGCPADDSFTTDYKVQSALRKGPMLRDFDVSMITHPGFQKYALDLAKEHGIKVQRSVRKGGGTNGAAYHLSGQGIPSIVVGIPVRYAHSHYGFVACEDYLAAKQLVLKIIESMTPEIYQDL